MGQKVGSEKYICELYLLSHATHFWLRPRPDKRSERKLTVLGQEATYFTDTGDLPLLSSNKLASLDQSNAGSLPLVSASAAGG
jgi:hypothetical protein